MPERTNRPIVFSSFAGAAAFVIFLPSLSGSWLNWDDWYLVSQNTHIRAFSWENIRWAFGTALGGAYQPLAYLTWMFDYAAWGADPRGYHFVNVLLHALNAALVFFAARRLLALGGPKGAPRDAVLDVAASFSALVFALHPLRVESVSWIAERRDTLCAALWLGAVLAYLRAREPGAPKRSLGPTYALFAAACLAKGIATTFPLVLIVVDAWPLRRPWRESVSEKLPMIGVGAALGAAAVVLQAGARASWSWKEHGPAARLAQTFYALVFYALKTVWPSGLSPYYEMRPPLNPLQPRFVAAAFLVAAVSAGLWRARTKHPAWAAAGAVYAVILLPVAGIFQAGEQLVADRYSYLAALPFALLAGAALRSGLRRPGARTAAALAAAAVVCSLAAATVAQESCWKDSSALWERALSLDASSPTALVNLGTARVDAGRVREAAGLFERALAADPVCLPAQGDPVKLETRPVCRKALNDLGAARAQMGEYPEARRLLSLASSADPGNENARSNLSRVEAILSRARRQPR